jgi:ATP-dependent Clp protease ATP-binding subunit ClpA
MSYDPQQFTTQSNKAIADALELAQESKHIELTPQHLASVLFAETASLGQRVCAKAQVSVKEVKEGIAGQCVWYCAYAHDMNLGG